MLHHQATLPGPAVHPAGPGSLVTLDV